MTKFIRILIVLFGFVLVFRTGSNVLRLWNTGDRLTNAQEKLAKVSSENEELKKKAEEVNKPEYMEKLAREKLGYGYEGEVVLVMPDEPNTESEILSSKEDVPNWKQWRKLYLGV